MDRARGRAAPRGTSTATLWSAMETLVLRYQHTCMVVLARWWLCLSKELREECMSSSDSCSTETSSEDPGGGEFGSGLRKLCERSWRSSEKGWCLVFFLSCNGPVLKYSLNVTAELLVLAPIAQLCLGQLTPQCGGEKNNTTTQATNKTPTLHLQLILSKEQEVLQGGTLQISAHPWQCQRQAQECWAIK